MCRRRAIAALSLCVASLFASTGHAQALADRVPGDALFYVGWAGSDAVTAASKDTRFAAVLAESKAQELMGRYLDEAEAKLIAAEPNARDAMQLFRTIYRPLWASPTAIYLAPPATGEGASPAPRLAILTTAGPEASRMADQFNAKIAQASANGEEAPVTIKAAAAGDLLCITFGFDDAGGAISHTKALATEPGFAAAVKKTKADGAIVWYANIEAAAALGERTLATQEPENAKKLTAFLDASGLRGAKRYMSVSGFDGKDWATQTFLDAASPRTGLLASAAGPIDPALLKTVPADATFFTSMRVDLAQGVRDVQAGLGKTDQDALKNFNMVLGAAHQVIGTSPLLNILDPLGADWVAYNSPTVNSSGLLGVVLVNKPEDPAKLKKALATATLNLTNWANIGIAQSQKDGHEPAMSIHGATTKIGNVDVNYLALPIIAPSWAIADGKLYLGFYPQSVGAAARYAGGSLVDGAKYKAAVARLGVASPTATSFNDLPAVAGTSSWYPSFLLVARYAGFGDLFGLTLPEPLLPPMDTLMANLTPSASATWADDAGIYSKTIVPFPGATMLTEQGALGIGGVGGAALSTSILLPSLNRARETANRVKSASNLKQMGMGMLLYSNENRNKYPDDFVSLLKTQDLVPEVMISPRTGSAIPADLTNADERIAYVAEHGDYVYLGKGLKNNASAETITAYEKPDGLEDGINVLFADGHVEFLFMQPALEEIEKQKAARGIE